MGQLQIKDRVVLFDDADAAIVAAYQWHLHPTAHATYVRGFARGRRKEGLVYMHRLLTGAQRGEDVDHANSEGLDNRRDNLRRCTRSQNSANRDAFAGSRSGIKGVHFETWSGRWRAEIKRGGKRVRIGRFDTAAEAASAYQAEAVRLYGEFARSTRV